MKVGKEMEVFLLQEGKKKEEESENKQGFVEIATLTHRLWGFIYSFQELTYRAHI